ncbi:MAG: HAMP domain-containing histidine kinase [Ruminococcus sp.]|nr:HAMP domain-containing histidine kinase [Ruminococcus sp.]
MLIFLVTLSYVLVISVSNSVLLKNLRNDLIMTVEDNVDEVEYYDSLQGVIDDNDNDHYFAYEDGYVEIDDDFIGVMNGIYSVIYAESGVQIYGTDPTNKKTDGEAFSDKGLKTVYVGGKRYYIYDRRLTNRGVENMWIRGIVSHEKADEPISDVARRSMIALIVLVILGIGGGYIIAMKSLKPIKDIEDVARDISQSGDLKKRIKLGKGNDELHSLANTFDTMFDRLEDSFESEKQFTNDVSHELRTPMAVIMAQCDYALGEEMTQEEYKESIELIRRQGSKMTKMITEMLEFSRIERRSEKYNVEELDFSELVENLCDDLALLKTKNITLECEVEPGIRVKGNRMLLTRLVSNLVSNAYRYGVENGRINITLLSNSKNAMLCVKDNGIGIAKDEQEKIFRRFYQTDPSHNGDGTGLGLSMVKEIVSFHGGSVCVKSEPGQGSEFLVRIPKV